MNLERDDRMKATTSDPVSTFVPHPPFSSDPPTSLANDLTDFE